MPEKQDIARVSARSSKFSRRWARNLNIKREVDTILDNLIELLPQTKQDYIDQLYNLLIIKDQAMANGEL